MSDIQKTADCLSNVVMNMDKKGEAKPKKTKVCVWAGYITEDEANEAVYYCKDCMGWVKIKNGLCKHLRGREIIGAVGRYGRGRNDTT